MAIYTFGKTVSAFITPSRARCTLGMSNDAAVSTPLLATLLCELTSNVLQRKLFDCIKTTTNTSVGSRVVIVDAVIFSLIRLLFRCTQNTNFYRIFFCVSFFPSKTTYKWMNNNSLFFLDCSRFSSSVYNFIMSNIRRVARRKLIPLLLLWLSKLFVC